MIANHEQPVLAVEVFAQNHGEHVEINDFAPKRDLVVTGVPLSKLKLLGAKLVGERDDAPVQRAKARLEVFRVDDRLGTKGGDLAQEAQLDLPLREIV